MPVPAVRAGGRDNMSSGSMMLIIGVKCVSPTVYFTLFSVLVMIDQGVTSLPVPAVVGIAINGNILRGVARFFFRRISAYSATLPPPASLEPQRLCGIERTAATETNNKVCLTCATFICDRVYGFCVGIRNSSRVRLPFYSC